MIYIIIPTYNEQENIKKLIPLICEVESDVNILVVDDNSPDGTGQVVSELAGSYPVTLLSRPSKMGIGSAYITGFRRALQTEAAYIMQMDADLSHDPQDIPRLVAAAKEGSDLAIGSRRITGGKIVGWGPARKCMSRGAMDFSRLVLGLKTRDVTAGFRCFRRQMIERLPLEKIHSNGYSFQEEVVFLVERLGGRVSEVPVTFNDRTHGKSKLSFAEVLKFFYVVARLRFRNVKKYYS
jgi:dolichol-phosphate mannosyltransferase